MLQEPSALEDGVRMAREAMSEIGKQAGLLVDQVNHVVETGKAHTQGNKTVHWKGELTAVSCFRCSIPTERRGQSACKSWSHCWRWHRWTYAWSA